MRCIMYTLYVITNWVMFSLLGNNTVIMYMLLLSTFYFMNLCVNVCSLNYMVLLQFLLCGVVSKFSFFFKSKP